MERKHNKKLTARAKELRKNMTPEEKHLWYDFLKDYSVRFLKQKVIDNYIVDFYCHEAKLIIELDGEQHHYREARLKDEKRTGVIEKRNLTVVRISNKDINEKFSSTCRYIDKLVKERIGEIK